MKKRLLTLIVTPLVLLTACSSSEKNDESPVERVLFDVDAYTGYGPSIVKVQRGISEAETAISKGAQEGMSTRDMNFDFFNEEMPRSSSFPGHMELFTVGGGLQPILSVKEGDPVIVAINDDQGYCYYLKAKIKDKKATFYRGLAIEPNCKAFPISKYTTWGSANDPDFPNLEDLTVPPEFISTTPPNGTGSGINTQPNGSMPNGSMPNGSMPNGSMPNGSMPNKTGSGNIPDTSNVDTLPKSDKQQD